MSRSTTSGFAAGVYPVEAQAGHRWRWTNGELVLDPQLWAGLEGGVSVLVAHNSPFTRAWLEPADGATFRRRTSFRGLSQPNSGPREAFDWRLAFAEISLSLRRSRHIARFR